ncbi:hypothetical protein BP6252_13128 [Coleophoma cylindrospora]|uniref:Clr5 domain-containing protein n=1 Tax=Coleophoma cylindrospora TaxID=1849047 RepID=A0A3D8Q9X8_9HELO|nr:hypothetical protein BP6252_13128 [Coleophoma cylindrospora]
MVPVAKKISKQEWDAHKDTILDLYHVRNLPLCKNEKSESVQSILETEHNFIASRNQLDAYVRSLERPKRLKKEEWRAVYTKLDELLAMGVEARVTLSGEVLGKERLQRSKRHAFHGHEHLIKSPSAEHALPLPSSLVIETQGADGEWSRYTSESMLVRANSPPSAKDLATLELETEESVPNDIAVHPSRFDALSQFRNIVSDEHPVLRLKSPPPLQHMNQCQPFSTFNYQRQRFDSPRLSGYSPRISLDLDLSGEFLSNGLESSTFEDSYTLQCWDRELTLSRFRTAVLATPTWGSHSEPPSLRYARSITGRETTLDGPLHPSPTSFVQLLLHDATEALDTNSIPEKVHQYSDGDDVLDSLQSLLSESDLQDCSGVTGEIVIGNTNLDSSFYNMFLYSLANGFAGLRNVPNGVIFKMLQQQNHFSSRIMECLWICPSAQAKCLVDNLFRAAVEACDEEAVTAILQATCDSPNAIDPNGIVCKIHNDDRSYTPIELAAKLRHLGMVKTLLAAKADVNKTYSQRSNEECGALELAVHKWGEFKAVDATLVKTILDGNAEVRVDLIMAVVRWGQMEIVQELFPRYSSAHHREFFPSREMRLSRVWIKEKLVEIAEYLENDLAASFIKRIFESCQSENCCRCFTDHQELMEQTLCSGARKANINLVEFLLPHTTMKTGGLAGAVRSGSRQLIDLFYLHGASLGGPTYYLDEIIALKYNTGERIPTTPLAEAIRSQDMDLVHEFEKLGALSHMDQARHFEAAIIAAAEIGNCQYMMKLLQQFPEKRGFHLLLALVMAIRRDRTEAALALLGTGAPLNDKELWRDPRYDHSYALNRHSPLLEALQKQNKAVVDAILEAGVKIRHESSAMEYAGLWGDITVIEDLVFMGANIDDGDKITALTAAVESRKTDLAKLLLERGASPSAKAHLGVTPLTRATENEDDDMIQLLISCGADPADEGAFRSIVEKHTECFDTLLRAFSSRYPNGKLSFGGAPLILAVERGDITLLNRMLAAKFDVNSFCEQEDCELTAVGYVIIHGKLADERSPIIRELINHGDPNSIVLRPKMYGISKCMHPETALLVAVESRSGYIVELLLAKGADIHWPARRGLKRTPLQRACEIGSFKMVKLLLKHGAGVNEEPAQRGGATALQLAAISGSIRIAELLLSRGALVHAAPAKIGGRTALEGAAEHGCVEMIKVLWNVSAGKGFTLEMIEKAKKLALDNGQRGCAEYLDSLSLSIPSAPLLEMNHFMGFEM